MATKRTQLIIISDPKPMTPPSVFSSASKVRRPLPGSAAAIKIFLVDNLLWVVTVLHLAWLLLYLILNLDSAQTVPLLLLTQKIEPAFTKTLLSKRAKSDPAPNRALAALQWLESQSLDLERRNEADKRFGARRVPNQVLNNQVNWLLNPQAVIPVNLSLETLYQTLVYVNHIKQHLPMETKLLLRIPLGYQLFILLVQIPLLLFLRSSSLLIERGEEEDSTNPKCTKGAKRTILLIAICLLLLVHFAFLVTTITVNLSTPTLDAVEEEATTTTRDATEPLRTPFSTGSTKSPLTFSNGASMATPTTVSKSITVHPRLDIAVRETKLSVNLSIFLVDLRHHLQLLKNAKQPWFNLPLLPSRSNTEIDALLTEWNTMNLHDPQNALASLNILTAIHRLHAMELNDLSSQMLAALARPSDLLPPTELQSLWLNSSQLWILPITLREQFAAWIREAKDVIDSNPVETTTTATTTTTSSRPTAAVEVTMLNYSFLFSNVVVFALLQLLCWTIYLYFIVTL